MVRIDGIDLSLRFATPDLDQFILDLEQMGARGQNMQPALDEVGGYVLGQLIPEQFKKQGTPKRWAPLSPRYAAWKRRRYGNLPILVLTGRMRKGFKIKTGPRSLSIVNTVKRRGGKPYWVYHQYGTRHMPRRPVLQLRMKDRQELRRIVLQYSLQRQGGVL